MAPPWEQYAKPSSSGNPWEKYGAAPPSAPSGATDDRNDLQKTFDENTAPSQSDSLLQTGLKSATRAVGSPFIHPIDTAKGLLSGFDLSTIPKAIQDAENHPENKPSMAQGIASGVGTMAGGALLGEGIGAAAKAVPKMASGVRSMAIGDPDAAALRGLQVGPKSPKTLGVLKSVEGARPYLQGAKNLEDLQAKVPLAKDEIWSPYKQAIEGIGDRPVKGPDGITTIRALEDERSQLSALNRGLKQQLPEAIQLAQQKGMTQAELLAREEAVKSALDPELAKTGIDPRGIRKTFGNVAQVGQRMSGKSTLIEPEQPTGFGKIANLSLEHPLQAPGKVLSGMRDLMAGRPLFGAKPTDLGIREGFRMAGPKPNLGEFKMPTVKGLLQAPMEDIPLHDPFQEPMGRPSLFEAQPNASRVGEPMVTPEGNPNYGYSDQSPELPATKGINQQGVLRRRSK